MTKTLSLQLLAAIALAAGGLSSCSSDGRADVVNPTAAQMDDMDVRWGLPKRVARGAPKRFYNSSDTSAPSAAATPAPVTGGSPAAPAAPAVGGGAIDPGVVDKLRQ